MDTAERTPPGSTTCCIVGCGPAGSMLGLMLARAGVDVVVLEKYPDFFRDFRGDTVHASTLTVLAELGLITGFERLPQQRTTTIGIMTDDGITMMGDFTSLPGAFQYITMVPQWDFLTFVTSEAARYPTFHLVREAEAVGLIEDGGVVGGVRYRTPGGPGEVRATLTVAADGRHSAIREAAGMPVREFGSPMDVLWYRLPKADGDPPGSFARLAPGRLFPMIDRGTYWQGAYTMPKGSYADLKARGIDALRDELRRWMPFLGDRVNTITGWDNVGFLEVRVNPLERWHRPGLLCIGDAAHAMSPVGGVGINLAVQDAVAAANQLAGRLRAGRVTEADLHAVQRRRQWPTNITQRLQLLMQDNMISPLLEGGSSAQLPRRFRFLLRSGFLRRRMSRFIAIGFRSEHVHTTAVTTPSGTPAAPH